jgi:hypothetical protein
MGRTAAGSQARREAGARGSVAANIGRDRKADLRAAGVVATIRRPQRGRPPPARAASRDDAAA